MGGIEVPVMARWIEPDNSNSPAWLHEFCHMPGSQPIRVGMAVSGFFEQTPKITARLRITRAHIGELKKVLPVNPDRVSNFPMNMGFTSPVKRPTLAPPHEELLIFLTFRIATKLPWRCCAS
jgi:hypothetical protein